LAMSLTTALPSRLVSSTRGVFPMQSTTLIGPLRI
jgi:hypothetical protein